MNRGILLLAAFALLSILTACGPAATPAATAPPPGSEATAAPPTPSPTVEETDELATAEATVEATTEPTVEPPPTAAPTATPEPTPEPVSYDPLALEVIARLNDWRLVQGLWPLKLNDTLTQMAQDQADYLASLPTAPDDWHRGPDGSNPRTRAPNYGWPSYNTPEQVAVGEIAYTGASVDAALNFWDGSQIHHDTVINDSFREVGAAVLPHPFGHLYIVVFGSRPNILTALLDPASDMVYLSSERYRWAASGERIQDIVDVRIIGADEGENGAEVWRPWQLYLRDPGTDPLEVEYSDGGRTVIVPVDKMTDVAWLSTNLPDDLYEQAVAEATEQEAELPALGPEPSGDVVLSYDEHTLAVVNDTGQNVDLSKLVIGEGEGALPAQRWQTAWLSAPLDSFPTGDCLQVWSWDEPDPGQPPDCGLRRAVIYIAPEQRFWAANDFNVSYDGQVLADCPAAAGECRVTLP